MTLSQRQKIPVEILYAGELARLVEKDSSPVPPGWRMSPVAVEQFISGDPALNISRKFVGSREQLTRIIVSLLTNRGVMLIGEPGTAKSWLSECLSAAVSGDSTLAIQGGSVHKTEQLLYSWNQILLNNRGPSLEAIIPSPIFQAMTLGRLVRFEEIVRCPQPLQDAVLSILSERMLVIPELASEGKEGVVFARPGFNIIATSNSRDQGLNQMSSALKRRLNFETIFPIQSLDDEIDVVLDECSKLLKLSGVEMTANASVINLLVTIFHELRNGQSVDGRSTDRLASTSMSTAEAVSVAHAMCLHAFYYANGELSPEGLPDFLIGATLKDNPEDRRRMRHYFETEVVNKKGAAWNAVYLKRHLF